MIIISWVFLIIFQTIHDVYDDLQKYKPTKNSNILTIFADTIANLESNKQLGPIIIELNIRYWIK